MPRYRLAFSFLVSISVSLVFADINVATAQTSLTAPIPGEEGKDRQLGMIIHVDSRNKIVMVEALNNAANLLEYYHSQNKPISVEIVANGPGIRIFRDDESPVKELLSSIHSKYPELRFSVCQISLKNISILEGKPVPTISYVTVVPSGVARIMALENAAYAYVKP